MTITDDLYITNWGLSDREGDAPAQDEIAHCELWIKQFCTLQKNINHNIGSYGLKHLAENWNSGLPENCKYVSNGAFIQAAVNPGYNYERIGNSQNALFNMRVNKGGAK